MRARDIAMEFIEFSERELNPERIAERFIASLQALGYEHIACASHVDPLKPRRGAVSVVNYPMPWLTHYSERDLAHIDPVFLAACRMTAPFSWKGLLERMSLSHAQKRMLAEAAGYGIVNGVTIPLRSPHVIPASCSLIPGRDGVDPLSMAETLMIVIFGHGAMHRRLNPDAVIDPVVLPARERECLELAGRGKSDWAIGQMLGLRKSSVHNSLERTKKRYGVSHRIQAVVRAAFEGQILLDGTD